MTKASPYVKGNQLEKQVKNLEQRMNWIQDTLEYWVKVQRGWMYLEPIFASEDIKKDMANEKSKFVTIDSSWRTVMAKFKAEPNIWDNIDSDRLRQDFQKDHNNLEIIQQKLSKYLEKKRQYFPRFYFLSDEELLEILADTKDPTKVQKHINKCFEAICALVFKNGQEVVGMISVEKENVPFLKPINVNEGQRKGNVEIWLDDIQKMMVDTLKDITRKAILDVSTPRTVWVRKWAGQVVLAVNMTRWTIGSEIAITKGKIGQSEHFKDLPSYFDHLTDQLKDIVDLVRQQLSALHREILGALIVLDVHAKDTIEDLRNLNTSSIQDFDWMSQLRYQWDESKKDHVLWVKMINANLKYGFEYLGNTPRLVVTPLTDRCYRTLMGAFNLQYGGAPEGPAGTGKTETTKDLAKANAVMCVVFNCSDQLNYIAMRKFFKGLSSSGGWCCFDEFNRIDLEVLSVVAQQVDQIQQAVKNKKASFFFDGEEDPIKLQLTCAINITMNPGYAGRSELPDNLKRLFRPCAMMVPDYSLIAEIYLYSVGYSRARELSKKITSSLRLSSEQLSSQYHYDFGMRGLKAILTSAGQLKRTMLDIDEEVVVMRALMDVNLPKFTTNDVPLFLGITSDLFPGTELPQPDRGKLIDSLISTCESLNLVSSQNFLNKCIQLFDTIAVRHGLMIVGASFSGKSSVLETLKLACSNLKGVMENFESVATLKLNPKSITADQLYGKLDPDSKQWSDGIISKLMRTCTKDVGNFIIIFKNTLENPEKKWIVFDGPVDAVWIENMNTVLDDNKKLCLTNGEIIKMTNQMTMMFEVDDLSQASPATVSRCGMVFLETQQLGWDPLVIAFCNQIPSTIIQYKEYMKKTLLWLINIAIAWALKKGRGYVHSSEMLMVDSSLKYLQTFLNPYIEREGKDVKVPKDIEGMLGNMCLFSVVWGIGGCLEENSRRVFSEILQKLITQAADIPEQYDIQNDLLFPFEPNDIPAKLPEKTQFFNLCYNETRNQWITWLQTESKFTPPQGGEYTNLLIPTSDSIRNNYFVQRALEHKFHLMICGPTGTGKTVNIINKITKTCKEDNQYANCITSFSGQTTANQVQKLIEGKVNSRRRKGVYGPEEGKSFIAIFIDDLNMPQKEVYGAQPPIEILRQWMDYSGWYDLETKEWKTLQGLTFISSMLPPTGGRNVITLRYQRHYNLLYVEPFEKESLFHIFTNVLDWYYAKEKIDIAAITQLKDRTVEATIDLYKSIQNSPQLAPIPSKSHYTYNLRDISKVFQGISKATNKAFKMDNDFIKLWAHEASRVFKDRLINQQDQDFFDSMLRDMVDKYMWVYILK